MSGARAPTLQLDYGGGCGGGSGKSAGKGVCCWTGCAGCAGCEPQGRWVIKFSLWWDAMTHHCTSLCRAAPRRAAPPYSAPCHDTPSSSSHAALHQKLLRQSTPLRTTPRHATPHTIFPLSPCTVPHPLFLAPLIPRTTRYRQRRRRLRRGEMARLTIATLPAGRMHRFWQVRHPFLQPGQMP